VHQGEHREVPYLMCGLFAVTFDGHNTQQEEAITRAWELCRERGRDSWGLYGIAQVELLDPEMLNVYGDEEERLDALYGFFEAMERGSILGNCRGEPTTEWINQKTDNDVQPFVSPSGDWIFIHNGTISNDKAIYAQLNVESTPTKIDSYAIGVALDKYGFGLTVNKVLEGSFAIVAVRTDDATKLHYATNYKPLFYRGLGGKHGGAVVGSTRSQVGLGNYNRLTDPGVHELTPYTWGYITPTEVHTSELSGHTRGSHKSLIVCSGGLDSTVAAWMMLAAGQEPTLLHFLHDARAQAKEVEAVEALSKRLGTEPIYISTDFFKVHASSVLTDTAREISKEDGSGNGGAEFAHEWVPARNTVFAALALAMAEANDFSSVAFGINLEEAGAFPDNEPEWANKVRKLLPYALKPYKRISFATPVANLMKHEIVNKGLALGVPFELTWSCYDGQDKHCGECGPCFNRRTAFKMNGSEDPVFS